MSKQCKHDEKIRVDQVPALKKFRFEGQDYQVIAWEPPVALGTAVLAVKLCDKPTVTFWPSDCHVAPLVEADDSEPEFPDLPGYEKITVDNLNNGETVLIEAARRQNGCDDAHSLSMEYMGHDRPIHLFTKTNTPCYRRAPAKIRADQVPDGRKFRRDNGDIHRRVVCPRDDKGSICGVSLTPNADLKMWIDPVELVTLLPE